MLESNAMPHQFALWLAHLIVGAIGGMVQLATRRT